MKNNKLAYLLALLAVVLWSTVGSAFKITLGYINYIQLLLFSSFTALLFLTGLIVYQKKTASLLLTKKKHIVSSAVMGLLNPFAYYLILFKAYSLLQAQEAVALNYTWPVILVLFSAFFFKQKLSWMNITAMLVSFTGTLVIATRGKILSLHFSDPVGVGLAVVSAFFWAMYWIMNMKDTRETTEKLLLNFFFGFIYIFIFSSLTGNLTLPSLQAGIGSVYIGLFEMGVTFVIWLNALKYAENTAAVSNLVYLSPFLSLMVVSVAVGEKIMTYTITGLLLIIGGIMLQQLVRKKTTGL